MGEGHSGHDRCKVPEAGGHVTSKEPRVAQLDRVKGAEQQQGRRRGAEGGMRGGWATEGLVGPVKMLAMGWRH